MVTKRYADIATELPAVLNVLQLFEDYMRVPHVRNLTERVQNLKEKLSVQVANDLQMAFQVNLLFILLRFRHLLVSTTKMLL